MKAIGFANKFYTLWDVTKEPMYTEVNGHHRQSGERCIRTYFQNLSTDLAKAQTKFTKMTGLQAPEPNDDLRGATRSWTTTENFQVYLENEFVYGKYVGQLITECTDVKYLEWYAYERDCKVAKLRLCEINPQYMLDEEGNLTTTKAERTRLIYKDIKEGQLEVTAVSNFKTTEEYPELGWVNVVIEPTTEDHYEFCTDNPYGVQIELIVTDLDLQRKFFQGTTYYTPKGMRSFKNTKFIVDNCRVKKL